MIGNGSSNGRDAEGRFTDGHALGFQPGNPGNPRGSSEIARFRAAVRRALKRRMKATLTKLAETQDLSGDENELDILGEEVVALALGRDKNAKEMLKECWAREDGPHQMRLAGPNGEPLDPLVLFANVDPEAMRAGRTPDACKPALPTNLEAPPSS